MASGKCFMYEKIYNDLLEAIRSGSYPAGSRLPSEKELTQQYEVSRITAKKALEMLAEQGLISRMPGRGSFVLGSGEQASEQTCAWAAAPEKRGSMVGVILDSFGPGYGEGLLRSIEQECTKRGYDLILKCTYGNIDAENNAIRSALDAGAGGLIIMCVQGETYNTSILKLALAGFPIVLLDRKMQGIPIPCVATDNRRAARELTQLLIARNHKKLCFVTHPFVGTSTIRERYEGFVEAIMENDGLDGCVLEIPGYAPAPEEQQNGRQNFNQEEFQRLLEQKRECTGFLCIEEAVCSILCGTMRQQGMTGEVTSFDGVGEDGWKQAIACILQDERQMGIRTLDTLEMLTGGADVPRDICVPYKMVKRNDI